MDIAKVCSKFERSDKHKFANFYQRYFESLNPNTLLEIGVLDGDSLRIWKEVFPTAYIFGIDINPTMKEINPDLNIFIGDQKDPCFLDFVFSQIGIPDIIIDDGAHSRSSHIQSLTYLFPKLKSNGLYIIEDTETGFLQNYNDFPINIIEFLKSLVTPRDFISERFDPHQNSFTYYAESITFEPNICLLRKA